MTDESMNALPERLARLEERMKTMQAEYRTDIARLAEDMAKRETRLLLAIAGMIGLAVAVLGLWLS
ncbi:MAG: hypothetical protein OXC91_03795 [Rhodobacteraceae bacterium]|nr:hypothetical protein [Paracoccaceae bacterium]